VKHLFFLDISFHSLESLYDLVYFLLEIVKQDENCGYDIKDRKRHEAGFDAFITGCCFIAMCQYLGTTQEPIKHRVAPDSPIVLPHVNK